MSLYTLGSISDSETDSDDDQPPPLKQRREEKFDKIDMQGDSQPKPKRQNIRVVQNEGAQPIPSTSTQPTPGTVNPWLEVDLYYKSTLLEVGLHRPVLPLSIIKTLLLEHF